MLGVALWLRLRVARLFALFILWLFAILVALLAAFNPRAVAQYWLGLPHMWLVVLALALCAACALFAIHVLSKYKGEFR